MKGHISTIYACNCLFRMCNMHCHSLLLHQHVEFALRESERDIYIYIYIYKENLPFFVVLFERKLRN